VSCSLPPTKLLKDPMELPVNKSLKLIFNDRLTQNSKEKQSIL
jgi:hypothetical protein